MSMKKQIIVFIFAILAIGSYLYPMKEKENMDPQNSVTIITKDGKFGIDKSIALAIPTIATALSPRFHEEKTNTITFRYLTTEQLKPIFEIVDELEKTQEISKSKRPDGKYIAQKIQLAIEKVLNSLNPVQLGRLIAAADFLGLDYMINGVIRLLAKKAYKVNQGATVEMVSRALPLELREKFKPIIAYQLPLVKFYDTPELNITDYIALKGMPAIQANTIDLSNKGITNLEGLDQIKGDLSSIKTLRLSSNALFAIPAHMFTQFKNLEKLLLNNNNISAIQPDAVDGLSKLQILDLDSNELKNIPSLDGLAQLKILQLGNNGITRIKPGAFKNFTNLHSLGLSVNDIVTIEADTFKGLSNLESLGLEGNKITQLPGNAFNGLASLQDLNLEENPIVEYFDEGRLKQDHPILRRVNIEI